MKGGAAQGTAASELGVVVVSFNTRALLGACLRSLRAEIDRCDGPAEVWVVDNASTDGSAEMVARDFPWARLDARDRNLGFTAANNRLLAPWASGDRPCPRRILLLNPDTELEPGALARLIEALEAAPRAAVVGPALHYADGRFQHAAFRFPGLLQTALDLFPVARLLDRPINGRYPRRRYAEGRPFAVDFVLGACMLVRGSALREVGPLDEGFFMYCEEIDWCQRFARAGWERLCVPGARVLHHAGAASGQPAFRAFAFVQLWRSRRRWFALHAPAWRRRGFALLLRLGLARRLLADWWAARRGRLPLADLAARSEAYRQVLRPLDPEAVERRRPLRREAS